MSVASSAHAGCCWDRLGSGAAVLLAVHLALTEIPAWADGQDAAGHA